MSIGFSPFGSWEEFQATMNMQGFAFQNLIGQDKFQNWTPGISFGGGTTGITYEVQRGRFYRMGRMVFVTYRVSLNTKGSLTTGARLTGLPATVSADTGSGDMPSALGYWANLSTSHIQVTAWPETGTTNALIYGAEAGDLSVTAMTGNDFTDQTQLIGCFWYWRA